jgi:hypothetical protein
MVAYMQARCPKCLSQRLLCATTNAYAMVGHYAYDRKGVVTCTASRMHVGGDRTTVASGY